MKPRNRRNGGSHYRPTTDATVEAAATAPELLHATARGDRGGEQLALAKTTGEGRHALVLLLSRLLVARLEADAVTLGLPVKILIENLTMPSLPTAGNGLMPTTPPDDHAKGDLAALVHATLAGDGAALASVLTALTPKEVGTQLALALSLLGALISDHADSVGVDDVKYFNEAIAPMLLGGPS